MIVAVIDIGSNSSRANVFDLNEDGAYEVVAFEREQTGLASCIDEYGNLSREGVGVTCSTLTELSERVLNSFVVDEWFVFATASLREAANCNDVVEAIADETGFEVEVITGVQEAAFGFASLRQRFDVDNAVLADVGGGSTELVVIHGGKVDSLVSLPLGCRRLSDAYICGLWPTKSELESMRQHVREVIESYQCNIAVGSTFFGIGGTAKALHRMTTANEPALPWNLRETAEQMCPERMDTIAAGALIFEELWERFKPHKFLASNANAREGYFVERVIPLLQGGRC